MQNNTQQKNLPDSTQKTNPEVDFAAKTAVPQVELERSPRKKNLSSLLALYTWGSLTTASVIFGGLFLVTEINIAHTRKLLSMEYPPGYHDDIGPLVEQRAKRIAKAKAADKVRKIALKKSRKARRLATKLVPAVELDQTLTGSIGKAQHRVANSNPIGYGVKISSSTSTDILASRYLTLSNRAPELFIGLKPKFQLSSSKSADLIIGPFSSEPELSSFCDELLARTAINCLQMPYSGNTLPVPAIN